MDLQEIIYQLSASRGPAGYEDPTAARSLLPRQAEIRQDAIGNLIAEFPGDPAAPQLLVTAPLDEPGFVVTGQEDGFLRIASLGAVERKSLPAAELLVLTEPPRYGVLAAMPPHVLQASDMENCPRVEQLSLDVGLPAEQIEKQIPPGTPLVFAGEPLPMGQNRLSGPGVGRRGAAAAAILAVRELAERCPVRLCLALTVQHGLYIRGAAPVAFSLAPDHILALDSGASGTGASLVFGPGVCRREALRLEALAQEAGIALRREVITGRSFTDNWVMQTVGGGSAVSLLRLPVRYPGCPNEIIDLQDCQALAAMVQAYAAALGKEWQNA